MNQTYTPGWNDPPPIPNGAQTANHFSGQFTVQRRRRLLDPSVQQGNSGGFALVNNSTGYSNPQHQQQQYPQQHQQVDLNYGNPVSSAPMNATVIPQHPGHNTQYPQQHQLQHNPVQHHYTPLNQNKAPQSNSGIQHPQGPIQHPQQFSTHPASAFTPTMAATNNNLLVQQSFDPRANNGQNMPNTQYNQEMTPVVSSNFTPAPSVPQFNAGNQSNIAAPVSTQTQVPQYAPVSSQQNIVQHNPIPEAFNSTQPITTQICGPPVSTQSVIFQPTPMMPPGEDPSSLIFSPPNLVNYANQGRPATQPDPNTYVAPTKAAGDVSLNGPQLVNFLIKATIRLQQGTMREGIQLNLSQLNDLVLASQLSEACLKKLNFVVDALDRGAYDEAQSFFDQLQLNFPNETAGTKWAQGVKFLILELKKQKCNQPTSMDHHSQVLRIGSAGTRMM
ncbi:hypothetical protein Ddc_06796 [Ditylenchus destructor]|nr:hypothetical protein Ddc_06796 [Ditylenchus destructor]